jgi:hypothetical protein
MPRNITAPLRQLALLDALLLDAPPPQGCFSDAVDLCFRDLEAELTSSSTSSPPSCQAEFKYLEEQIRSQEEDTDLLLVGGVLALLQ